MTSQNKPSREPNALGAHSTTPSWPPLLAPFAPLMSVCWLTALFQSSTHHTFVLTMEPHLMVLLSCLQGQVHVLGRRARPRAKVFEFSESASILECYLLQFIHHFCLRLMGQNGFTQLQLREAEKKINFSLVTFQLPIKTKVVLLRKGRFCN